MIRLHVIFSTILVLLAALSSYMLWRSMFPGDIFVMWLIGALTVITVSLGHRFLWSREMQLSKSWFLLVLIAITLAPRIWWVLNSETIPFADFAGYDNYAKQVAMGNFMGYTPVMPLFPFKFIYPFIIGCAYWLTTPSPYVAQVLNILFSIILAYQVYRLGAMAGGEQAGRLAGILFALWPSQIAFCSVVAQEHLFTVFVLGAIIFLLRTRSAPSQKSILIYCMITGGMIAVAHSLRPVALILFPTLLTYLIWADAKTFSTWRKRATALLATIAGFGIVFSTIMIPASYTVNVPVWKSSAGFSLYIGTYPGSRGYWTSKSAQIIDECKYDFDAVHSTSTKRAIQTIVGNPTEFVNLVKTKFYHFWGSDEYGMYSSTVEQRVTPGSTWIKTHQYHLNLFTHGAYFIILMFTAIGMYRMRSMSNHAMFIIQSVFLLHVAAFSLLEIMSRYHMLVIAMFMIPAAIGVSRITSQSQEPA